MHQRGYFHRDLKPGWFLCFCHYSVEMFP
jgi:hypothetical protein